MYVQYNTTRSLFEVDMTSNLMSENVNSWISATNIFLMNKELYVQVISRKSKSAERFKVVSEAIISWSAVTKSSIAYEIWDLMSFEIWRLDQISDITEYSPKKKSESAITFPHNLSSHIQVYPG